MNTLAHFTNPNLIVPELDTDSAAEAVGELCSLLHREGCVNDSAAFADAVIHRERLCSTAIAPGWALPHARLSDVTELAFALARASQPLIWFGEKGIRPQIIFLFAVPEVQTKAYLTLLAAVARLNQNSSLAEEMLNAPDGNSIFRILQQVPLRRQAPRVAASIG